MMVWESSSRKARPLRNESSERLSKQLGLVMPHGERGNWFAEKGHWTACRCPASWQTVRNVRRTWRRSLSWKEIPQAGPPSWDVIVDHVLLDPVWVTDLADRLAAHDVFRVGVTCPVEVLDAREAARGDRTLGQASAQHRVVHDLMPYDVVVDTSLGSPEECAHEVLQAWRLG